MKKQKLKFVLVALLLVAVLVSAAACTSVSGIYYKYRGGEKNENDWIELKGGKWMESSGFNGTYEIKGDAITFYVLYGGENEVFMEGIISKGVLTYSFLGFSNEYRK